MWAASHCKVSVKNGVLETAILGADVSNSFCTRSLPCVLLSSLIMCYCYVAWLQVQVYKFVVEDVIRNVKEDFLNEGVEPEVLDQLQEVSSFMSSLSFSVCISILIFNRRIVCFSLSGVVVTLPTSSSFVTSYISVVAKKRGSHRCCQSPAETTA